MKRFLIKGSVLFIVIIMGIAAAEYGLRRLPNDYNYKAKYMAENAHRIKTLIIGASDGLMGIDPDYMDSGTFNLSFSSQTFEYSYHLFNYYIDELDSLETIILPVSYPYPFERMEINGGEPWRSRYYKIYFNSQTDIDFSLDNLLLTVNKGWGLYKHAIKCIFGKGLSVSELGFGTTYTLRNRHINWREQSSDWAIGQTKKEYKERDTILNANILLLDKMIRQCSDKGIVMYLITTPVYMDYYNACNPEQLNLRDDFCIEASRNSDNVYYYNFSQDEDFIDDDFFDGCHLSNIGAKKFSIKLQRLILDNRRE